MLGWYSWVKKYIKHEPYFIVRRGTTYSDQKHPLGWGGGGEVSNSIGYRSAESWRSEKKGNIPLKSSCGRARTVGREEVVGKGGRGGVQVRT